MGVDGISVLFVVLTAALLPVCVLASWDSITTRVREYMIVFLILETLMIGVFATLDLAMFYVFFEGSLIPMFLIIGIWGGPRRIQAAYKFFFYTLHRHRADAPRHHGDVLAGGHARYRQAPRLQVRTRACRPGSGSPSSPRSR